MGQKSDEEGPCGGGNGLSDSTKEKGGN